MQNKRAAFTLIETVVVLCIDSVVGLSGQQLLPSKSADAWVTFEQQFDLAYEKARQRQLYMGQAFAVIAQGDAVFVDNQRVPLPAGWVARYRMVECRRHYVKPATIMMWHADRPKPVRLVFQFGGGTYELQT